MGRTKYVEIKAVMESDEEDLKDKLRANEMKTHGAYEELRKRQEDEKALPVVVKQKNTAKLASKAFLRNEKKIADAKKKRYELFDALEIERVVKFEYCQDGKNSQMYRFYIEVDGTKVYLTDTIFCVSSPEEPICYSWLIPDTWYDSFVEAWNQAYNDYIDNKPFQKN